MHIVRTDHHTKHHKIHGCEEFQELPSDLSAGRLFAEKSEFLKLLIDNRHLLLQLFANLFTTDIKFFSEVLKTYKHAIPANEIKKIKLCLTAAISF